MNKNNTIKWIRNDSFLLSFLCIFFCLTVSCGGDDDSSAGIPVKGVSLSSLSLTMQKGTTSDLHAIITPSNATNKEVTWTSSDTSVASISKIGAVTAINPGNAIITVITTDGNCKAVCYITVVSKIESITLKKTELTIVEGDEETLVAAILPENALNKTIIWKSSDKSVATVSSSGTVTALNAGKTTISATSEDGVVKATCSVTVKTGTNINYNPYGEKQNW